MKRASIFIPILILLLTFNLIAGDDLWNDNFEGAKQKAKDMDKYILVNFSGSDWCSWCKKLNSEVFSKEAFKKYAEKDLILFIADFPKFKSQSEELKTQNTALAQKYKVRGFPTVLILNPKGELVATTGYRDGGAASYVAYLKQIIKDDKVEQKEG